jgi:hypothetical protein
MINPAEGGGVSTVVCQAGRFRPIRYQISIRSEHLKILKKNTISSTSSIMSHITEHPSRAKRRKLDEPEAEKPAVISNIKNPSQLRELLAVQQNAPLAKQGETDR